MQCRGGVGCLAYSWVEHICILHAMAFAAGYEKWFCVDCAAYGSMAFPDLLNHLLCLLISTTIQKVWCFLSLDIPWFPCSLNSPHQVGYSKIVDHNMEGTLKTVHLLQYPSFKRTFRVLTSFPTLIHLPHPTTPIMLLYLHKSHPFYQDENGRFLLQRMSLVVFSWDVIHRWHVLKSLSFPQLPWGLYRDYAITYPKQAHEMRVGSGWKPCRVRLWVIRRSNFWSTNVSLHQLEHRWAFALHSLPPFCILGAGLLSSKVAGCLLKVVIFRVRRNSN